MYLGAGATDVTGKIDDIVWDMGWAIRLNDIANCITRVGFIDQVNVATPNNMIGFVVTNTASAGEWFGITRAAATEVVNQTTAETADLNWHEFRIKCDGAGNVTWYIDGALIATDTSNVPTAGMRICIQQVNTDGVSSDVYVDWFDLEMEVDR